jgi:hypothetical protein
MAAYLIRTRVVAESAVGIGKFVQETGGAYVAWVVTWM